MTAKCKSMIFNMIDSESQEEWRQTLDLSDGVRFMNLSHKFLPDSAEEEITILIIRRSDESVKMANYIKNLQMFNL